MSRTRQATINFAFTSAQFAFGLVTGVLLTPIIINQIGQKTYGLWLTASELFLYVALTDLGVFTVVPWIIARAQGEENVDLARRALAHALLFGVAVSGLTLLAGAGVWLIKPEWLRLTPADWDVVAWPVTIMAISTALVCPTHVFTAALTGRQDYTFGGFLGLAKGAIATTLTVTLVLSGYGLYGLALAGLPAALAGLVAAMRVSIKHRDLVTDWPRPSWAGVRWLLREAFPGWMAGFGHRLVTASNGIVLAIVGGPIWVAIYACTTKAHIILQPMTWMIPDSGLIGLAQLHGEGKADRTRAVIRLLIAMNLFLAGGAACGLCALNPLFVRQWVGPDLFGGHKLNLVLVAGFVFAGAMHGVITGLAVTGCPRVQLGSVLLANGMLSVGLAAVFSWAFGLPGAALASIVATVPTSLAFGLYALRRYHSLSPGTLLFGTVWPWFRASAVPLAASVILGFMDCPAWITVFGATFCCLGYLLAHRRTMTEFPMPASLRSALLRWLPGVKHGPATDLKSSS